MLRNILRTDKTYVSPENAIKALNAVLTKLDIQNDVHYLIAVHENGRFAPVVVGSKWVLLSHHGITVVGG